nr:MAG TPA: hypothetical protein [Caudoviricetes sp.]
MTYPIQTHQQVAVNALSAGLQPGGVTLFAPAFLPKSAPFKTPPVALHPL